MQGAAYTILQIVDVDVEEGMRMVKLAVKYDLMGRVANVTGLMPQRGSPELRTVEGRLTW
jgi:hypothetical protein